MMFSGPLLYYRAFGEVIVTQTVGLRKIYSENGHIRHRRGRSSEHLKGMNVLLLPVLLHLGTITDRIPRRHFHAQRHSSLTPYVNAGGGGSCKEGKYL